MPYTKLFNSIITSSLWLEPDHTRLVWITMLALADKNGEVQASVPGLARLAGVELDACQEALSALLSPDPHSRTKTAEGRRIVEIEGGWELINHAKYRRMASEEDKREANARRQERFRIRNTDVTDSNATSRSSNAKVTQDDHKQRAEAPSEAAPEASKQHPPLPASPLFSREGFTDEWRNFVLSRKKMKKPMTERAEQLILTRLEENPRRAIAALQMCIMRGWQSFEWEWLDKQSGNGFGKPARTGPVGTRSNPLL